MTLRMKEPPSTDARLVAGLGYLGVTAESIPEWTNFATSILGMGRQHESEDLGRYQIDERLWRLQVQRAKGTALAFIGWELDDAEHLAAVQEQLHAAGLAIEKVLPEELHDRGVKSMIRSVDPDGNRLEFFVDAPRPAEPSTLLRERFVTGRNGMGHVVLATERLDEQLELYTALLRFTVTDYRVEPREMYFLGCNRRHHSIAFLKAGGALQNGLHHFMLEVSMLEAVGKAYDWALDADVVTGTLGAHDNDRMTSCYLRTPSGFDVEYGWGGIEIDRETWSTQRGNGPTSLWGHRFTGSD